MAEALAALRRELRFVLSLRVLPARVARFLWSAHLHARRDDDRFSLVSPVRPAELAELLALARGRRMVVELGTGTAWSAIALALDDRARRVVSCDPCVRHEREAYLDLGGPAVRRSIELRQEPDSAGPRPGEEPVELLFIDSSHALEPTVTAFRAWRDALASGALVIFHDYGNPDYPGVREAIAELELTGRQSGGLFVWQAP